MNGYEYLESRALKETFTDADQKELLEEITNAAVVYAKDFRLELHGIASVLVWIEAAKRYAIPAIMRTECSILLWSMSLRRWGMQEEFRKSILYRVRADNLICL